IKWIEDLVPRAMWIQEPINYDKHALWRVSHWGWKHQQFYGFAVNRESALNVYSKRRIIAVTDIKIVEWHNYKHLDWISLSNLTVEERFAFNVSLRMFMRSIVIQRRMEDLQLGVKSYQKRLNLTKPDTYRFDLKRREAYTAYSNPRGFIYQNRDKKNRLMWIDELHKFSDGTLNDVCNALDDRLKGIRMKKVSLMLEILSRRFFLKFNLSDHMSILMDLQGTLKGKWRYLIPAKPPIHNHVLIPNYQDIKIQDFCYSDGFKCFQATKIGMYEHEVIVNGDSVTAVASASTEDPIPPKTSKQKLARKNKLKEKSTLVLAIPNEHLLKFHACKDAKSLWKEIKNKFGGNEESKKMQKIILKQNYENFDATSQEGLNKTYDRFQKLISQLEIHDEVISQEDANLKLLRNNTSSTNETVNTGHNISAARSKDQASTASYVDDVMFSLFSNQSNAPHLDNKDLEHIDTDNLEEMDLKWQVSMLNMRVKRIDYFARKCRAPKNQGNKNRDAPTRNAPVDTSTTNGLVVQDGMGGYD
nr:hypothetical protein [Tanacetum cinerariifolium]